MTRLLALALLALAGCAKPLAPAVCYTVKADTLVFKNAAGDTVALSIVPAHEVCR